MEAISEPLGSVAIGQPLAGWIIDIAPQPGFPCAYSRIRRSAREVLSTLRQPRHGIPRSFNHRSDGELTAIGYSPASPRHVVGRTASPIALAVNTGLAGAERKNDSLTRAGLAGPVCAQSKGTPSRGGPGENRRNSTRPRLRHIDFIFLSLLWF